MNALCFHIFFGNCLKYLRISYLCFISGYAIPGEDRIIRSSFEYPTKIIIDASDGASDYGNKFGEPIIGGFFRSFGANFLGERREWVKPIMFTSGIGLIDDKHVKKYNDNKVSELGAVCIAKIGGPAYRIGLGGGAASSAVVQGEAENSALHAVQRGDPEMGNKLNRFIRSCIELGDKNPIRSIHDQGAGGNANVLKELVGDNGAVVYANQFTLGDKTLQLHELWCAEYQESNAILFSYQNRNVLKKISLRERCTLDEVGKLTQGENFIFSHASTPIGDLPVNLPILTLNESLPRKEYCWSTRLECPPQMVVPDVTVDEALKLVFQVPSVGSKRFLTSKVDRSVTGLIAQQQCVGLGQHPVADVMVTACSYFSKKGGAKTIGEQPIIGLVNPEAGGRMALLEALASMVMAPISCLKDVKCSVNWMWPAKLEGEGHTMYRTCNALVNLMKLLGVGADGGKDSLGMAAKVKDDHGEDEIIKAPGTVVVTAYAPCTDITKVRTIFELTTWSGVAFKI